MTEFGEIDDPVDASFEAWRDDTQGLGGKFGDLSLNVSGLIFPPARYWKIIRDQFFPENRFERVNYLFDGVRLGLQAKTEEIQSLKDSVAEHAETIKSLQERIDRPQFDEDLAVAFEESARAVNRKMIDRFVRILLGSLSPTPWYGPEENAATLIRDVAQLSDLDIFVLREIGNIFENVGGPNFNLYNQYTENMQALRDAIKRSNLHQDDFQAICSRLAGFGLALEEPRNPSRMELHERLFRPTHRGVMLLKYLAAEPAPK
jgi:hypothetical protein